MEIVLALLYVVIHAAAVIQPAEGKRLAMIDLQCMHDLDKKLLCYRILHEN